MRKLGILTICAILLAQLFSGAVVFGATGISVVDSSIITSKNYITEGDKIQISLTCKNSTGGAISDISLNISSSSSFYGINGSTLYPEIAVWDDGDEIKWTDSTHIINLGYKGTSKEFAFTIRYKDAGGDYVEEAQSIYVEKAYPSDSSSGTSTTTTDTTKYKPKLTAAVSSTNYTASAGTTKTLTLPIKNASSYAAKSVTISLAMDKAEQVLENYNLTYNIDQIAANETKEATFDLNILSSAPEGIYPIKITYSCTNPYGDAMDATTETIYIRILNFNTSPLLAVDSIEVNPSTAAPGENVDLKINIANLGNITASNITVTLKGMKNTGFTLDNTTDVKSIKRLEGGSTTSVTYKLKASTSIPSGNNELQVKIDYSDGTTAKTAEDQIFIPVSRSGTGKGLVLQNIQSPNGTMISNKDFKISFVLANTGLTDISDIKVSLSSDKEIVCKSMSSYMIDTLGKGASKKFEFTLFATQDATTKNYPVAINVEYGEAQGENAAKASLSQYVGVFVDNEGSGKSVPRIIIDNYSYSPEQVNAGDEFTLKMSYLNTSRLVNISNIKVTVSSDDGTFTPVNSSNTFFIDTLATKKNIEKTLVLKAKPGSEPKAYALSINFDYEDDKGNQYNTKETISIPVQQLPKLVTGEIMLPAEAYIGQPTTVSLEFYNMGKVTLYNLMVKAEGDFQAQGANYYVGNFDAGRSDSFEVQLTPNAVGEMKGNIIFAFEDVAGKAIEIKKDFSINVIEMVVQEMDPGKMLPMGPDGKPINPQAKKGFNILYVIIPAVVIIAVIVFIIIRKKRISRRELSLDE